MTAPGEPPAVLGPPRGDRPAEPAVERMWRRLSFEAVPVGDDPLLEYVDTLDGLLVNGGAELARLRVPENDTFDWYAAANRLGEVGVAERLLASDAPNDAVPALDTRDGVTAAPDPERVHSLVLAGHLAVVLVQGGAYRSFEGSHAEARELAERARAALFGERYGEVAVRRSGAQWSDWFRGVPHPDDTWVALDRRTREVSVLVATDTD